MSSEILNADAEQFIEGKGCLFICTLCHDFLPDQHFPVKRHILKLHFGHSEEYNGQRIPLCKLFCKKGGSHYHCVCGCNKVFTKKTRLKCHLDKIIKNKNGANSGANNAHCVNTGIENNNAGMANNGSDDPVVNAGSDDPVVNAGSDDPVVNAGSDDPVVNAASDDDPVVNAGRDDPVVNAGSDDHVVNAGSSADPMNTGIVNNAGMANNGSADPMVNTGIASNNGVVAAASNSKAAAQVKCPSCDLIMYKKNLVLHIKRKHGQPSYLVESNKLLTGSCVDEKQGMYLVSERKSGVPYPVHVQKLICGNQSKIDCDAKRCGVQKVIAGISGKASYECIHLLSVPHCTVPSPVNLDPSVLEDLVKNQRMQEETKKSCLVQKSLAIGSGCESVHAMVTSSERWIFISVWEPKKSHYSKLGRVSLTYDRKKIDLVCNCTRSSRISCKHKPMAKWYLFCAFPDLVLSDSTSPSTPRITLAKQYEWAVEYLFNKKIDINSLIVDSKSYEVTLKPSEEICVKCFEPLKLKETEGNSRVLTIHGFVKIKVSYKHCNRCNLEYHYNDVNHGLFNFNDKFLVSIDWLVWLRNANYVHTAISRELETLQFQLKVSIDFDLVRKTFYKFLALIDYKDCFHCYVCGHYPYLLTFDVIRKCCFKLLQRCHESPTKPEINGKEFWDNLDKHMISQTTNSSIQIEPFFDYWAPYIGERTSRRDGIVYNSEYLKAGQDQVDEQEFLECLSEETLESLLDTDVSTLRGLCEECGISARGLSKTNCIMRLTQALKDKTKIDKFFFKLWHSSGGLLTGTCEHGVVYAFKSLLCPESSRDIGDILLSMQFPPTVTISDIPHMVASHMNKRVPNFFFPHGGRVIDPTDENVQLAKDDKLPRQSLPHLNRRMEKAVQPSEEAMFSCDSHPVTRINMRYSLYDKFHQSNTKQAKEFLRRTGHVMELDGVVTETAEQLNSYLSKSIYFLDVLSPGAYLLVIRSILAMRNREINAKIIGDLPHTFDVLGRIMDMRGKSNHVQQPAVHVHLETSSPVQSSPIPSTNLKRPVKVPSNNVRPKIIKLDGRGVSVNCPLSTDDNTFFDAIKVLYNGLENPLNNCWFNSVMVGICNTFGASRLYEDLSDHSSFGSNFESLKPVLSVLDLKGELGSLVLKDCLGACFPEGVGDQRDPYAFFLSSLHYMNHNSEMLNFLPVSMIKLTARYSCSKCGSSFDVFETESCLSLSLINEGRNSTLLQLVNKYMGHDVLIRNCDKCDSRDAVAVRKLRNSPTLLALQIKRYNENFEKSKEFVSLDKTLDIGGFSDVSNTGKHQSIYDLRAVITHKGETINSGHYTTILYEKGKDLFIEIDGTKVLLLDQVVHLCSGGYLALYENTAVMEELVQKWFPLSLILFSIDSLLIDTSPMVYTFFSNFRNVLQSCDLDQCTTILGSFSAKLARLYPLKNDIQASLLSLFKIFGVKEEGTSYFSGNFYCTSCDHYQKHIRKYAVLKCLDISVKSIVNRVYRDFQGASCYNCDTIMMELDSQPIFLSDLLIISTQGDYVSLEDDHDSMRGVHSFSAVALVQENHVLIMENDRCLQANVNKELFEQEDLSSLDGERLVLLRGEEPYLNLHDFKAEDIPCFTKEYDINTREDMIYYLDACLNNFKPDVSPQNVLLHGIVEPSFISSFFHLLLDNVYVLSYNLLDFIAASIGSILYNMKMKKVHTFILFYFQDALCLHKFREDTIYCIGKITPGILRKVMSIIDTHKDYYCSHTKFDVHHYGLSYNLSRLQIMKVAYCIAKEEDFVEVENQQFINIALVALYLGIPPVTDSESLLNAVKVRCPFIHCVHMQPLLDVPVRALVGNCGQLFNKDMKVDQVYGKVAEFYRVRASTQLHYGLFQNILQFVMENKEIVTAYYFLDEKRVDECDVKRIKTILKQNPIYIIHGFFRKMLSCIPEMAVYCMVDTLLVLLHDASHIDFVRNTLITHKFHLSDYITIVVGKKVLIEYVAQSLNIASQDVEKYTGAVGKPSE